MRLIVCGSRDFDDAKLLAHVLDNIWQNANFPALTVVHGGARGADSLAGEWARSSLTTHVGKVAEEVHMAEWDKRGNAAGPFRNRAMAASGADLCLAFWDGKSRGTADMLGAATQYNIRSQIVPWKRKNGT